MNGQKEGENGNRELTPPSKRAEQIAESFLGTSFERGKKEGSFTRAEINDFFARHNEGNPEHLSDPEKDYVIQRLAIEGILKEKGDIARE